MNEDEMGYFFLSQFHATQELPRDLRWLWHSSLPPCPTAIVKVYKWHLASGNLRSFSLDSPASKRGPLFRFAEVRRVFGGTCGGI